MVSWLVVSYTPFPYRVLAPSAAASDNGFGSYYAHMKVGEQTDDYLMFIDNGVGAIPIYVP